MEEKTTVKRKIKKIMHVLNPLAGKGTASKIKQSIKGDDCVYMSKSPDETTEFIKKSCEENPDTCFTVYGGDGTVFKAVNALMESGYADRASLKIVPAGSGNDFVRSFVGKSGEMEIDVMKFNGRYAANVINMGFDCSVVKRAAKLKKSPLIPGKLAYTFGVAGELFARKSIKGTVTFTYADGSREIVHDEFLLIAVANGLWYGGGYKVAPAAKLDDGLVDVLAIRNISTAKFVSLVGAFKKGLLVNEETGEVREDLKQVIIYRKCVGAKIEGCTSVCADGEIFEESVVEVGVVPKAINLVID